MMPADLKSLRLGLHDALPNDQDRAVWWELAPEQYDDGTIQQLFGLRGCRKPPVDRSAARVTITGVEAEGLEGNLLRVLDGSIPLVTEAEILAGVGFWVRPIGACRRTLRIWGFATRGPVQLELDLLLREIEWE